MPACRVSVLAFGAGILLVAGACSDSSTEPITVASVLVAPSNGEVQVGHSLQLSAEARGANGQVVSNSSVEWRSQHPNVATVGATGIVQGVSPGTARITATVDEIAASVDVAVFDLPQVQTLPATDVTGSSGVPTGRVNPRGSPTEFTFELGLTPILNERCTGDSPPLTGLDDVMVGCTITGQPEGRTIYYRVVAENRAGRAEGATLSFTTTSAEPAGMAILPAAVDGDVHWVGNYSVDTESPALTIQRSSGNNVRNAVMEFDVSSLPVGATIGAARLRVTTAGLVSNIGGLAPLHLHGFIGDGAVTEGDHEREEPGVWIQTLDVPTGSATPSGTVLVFEFDDLGWLQDMVNDGATYIALRIQTEDFATVTIHSLETEDPSATPPTLEIEFE